MRRGNLIVQIGNRTVQIDRYFHRGVFSSLQLTIATRSANEQLNSPRPRHSAAFGKRPLRAAHIARHDGNACPGKQQADARLELRKLAGWRASALRKQNQNVAWRLQQFLAESQTLADIRLTIERQ